MGNTDSIPVVSQVKSGVQVAAGDTEGAKKTWNNFTKGCPVVSQLYSLGEAAGGDTKAARDRQQEFLHGMGDLLDGTPMIGHAKGFVHLAMGDKEKFETSEKAASRSVGVVLGGLGGFIMAGPAGAFSGGVAGGLAVDCATTGIESAVKQEYKPAGTIAAIESATGGLGQCESRSGAIFDLAFGTIMDGFAGIAAGEIYAKQTAAPKGKKVSKGKVSKHRAVKGVPENSLKSLGKVTRAKPGNEVKYKATKNKAAVKSKMSSGKTVTSGKPASKPIPSKNSYCDLSGLKKRAKTKSVSGKVSTSKGTHNTLKGTLVKTAKSPTAQKIISASTERLKTMAVQEALHTAGAVVKGDIDDSTLLGTTVGAVQGIAAALITKNGIILTSGGSTDNNNNQNNKGKSEGCTVSEDIRRALDENDRNDLTEKMNSLNQGENCTHDENGLADDMVVENQEILNTECKDWSHESDETEVLFSSNMIQEEDIYDIIYSSEDDSCELDYDDEIDLLEDAENEAYVVALTIGMQKMLV